MIFIFFGLEMVFSLKIYFPFFFFFEAILIPIGLIILLSGGYSSRFLAFFYFLIYTVIRSIFFTLVVIFFIKEGYKSYSLSEFISNANMINFLIVLGFLVKIPVYPFHLWLLKAHLEAPVVGSIILSGILLKLGVYGLIRFIEFYSFNFMRDNFIFLCLIGSILVSLFCLRRQDYKLIVANSSVVHISLCLLLLNQFSVFSLKGCVIIIIRHGLSSSGLFFITSLFYENSNSRRFIILKGLLLSRPFFCL